MHPAPQRASTSRLKKLSVTLANFASRSRHRALTWAVEPLGASDIKHDPGNGEQNPPAVLPVEICEGARGIRRKEQRRSVRTGHPRVASFKLCEGRARDGGGGKENALKKVKNVEQQGRVDRV